MLKEEAIKKLIFIANQFYRGTITIEEAANKAVDLAVGNDQEIIPQKYLDSLIVAERAKYEKELAVSRLVQASNEETNYWNKLFNLILLDNGVKN